MPGPNSERHSIRRCPFRNKDRKVDPALLAMREKKGELFGPILRGLSERFESRRKDPLQSGFAEYQADILRSSAVIFAHRFQEGKVVNQGERVSLRLRDQSLLKKVKGSFVSGVTSLASLKEMCSDQSSVEAMAQTLFLGVRSYLQAEVIEYCFQIRFGKKFNHLRGPYNELSRLYAISGSGKEPIFQYPDNILIQGISSGLCFLMGTHVTGPRNAQRLVGRRPIFNDIHQLNTEAFEEAFPLGKMPLEILEDLQLHEVFYPDAIPDHRLALQWSVDESKTRAHVAFPHEWLHPSELRKIAKERGNLPRLLPGEDFPGALGPAVWCPAFRALVCGADGKPSTFVLRLRDHLDFIARYVLEDAYADERIPIYVELR